MDNSPPWSGPALQRCTTSPLTEQGVKAQVRSCNGEGVEALQAASENLWFARGLVCGTNLSRRCYSTGIWLLTEVERCWRRGTNVTKVHVSSSAKNRIVLFKTHSISDNFMNLHEHHLVGADCFDGFSKKLPKKVGRKKGYPMQKSKESVLPETKQWSMVYPSSVHDNSFRKKSKPGKKRNRKTKKSSLLNKQQRKSSSS